MLATLAHFQTARKEGVTVCTSRDLAQDLSHGVLGHHISASTIVRLWDAMAVKPWRWHYWLESRDPDFVAKSSYTNAQKNNPAHLRSRQRTIQPIDSTTLSVFLHWLERP